MRISKQIGHTHREEMERILDFITSFDVDRLLYAIDMKRLDEAAIKDITLDIREQNVKLDRQKISLIRYAKDFNTEYTHPDNKMIDSSAIMSRKMKSGIKGMELIVWSFCRKSRRKLQQGQTAPQAIDRSHIATESFMRNLFGLETYPDFVKLLFVEMCTFYNNVQECLEVTLRTLEEEKHVKKNKPRCKELLEQKIDECKEEQSRLFSALKEMPDGEMNILLTKTFTPDDNNPMLQAWTTMKESEEGKAEFASTYFHNCSPEDVGQLSLFDTLTETDGDAELATCMSTFKCDIVKARKINQAISRFDRLLPKECKRKVIPSIYLYAFMLWCSNTIKQNKFLKYFNKRYKDSGGKWELIGTTALSGASAQHANSTTKYKDVETDLLKKLKKMFPE